MDNSRGDVTIVYYSSNREQPSFEQKIVSQLVQRAGPSPIISVSQAPMDLGTNICVGNQGTSPANAFRQLQIGAAAATTTFVCTAESDFLYPRDYFDLVPSDPQTFYCMHDMWVVFVCRGRAKMFFQKFSADAGAMIVGRDVLVRRIDEILSGYPTWAPGAAGIGFPSIVDKRCVRREEVVLKEPILSFKTDQNMHRKTPIRRITGCRELAPYGSAMELYREFCRHG